MKRADKVASLHGSFARLARCFDQLMRGKLSCCPITVQQCYALEALADGPMSMKALAAQVGIHQSTLTRIVEKLEKQGLASRTRKRGNQRSVEVEITEAGKLAYEALDEGCKQMTASLLDLIPKKQQDSVVESLTLVASLLDPGNDAFQVVLKGCCSGEAGTGPEACAP